jgi:hypothetical protein
MANYVLLDRIELNATAASVTFDNIPQSGYTDLKIVYSVRGNNSSGSQFTISFNNSTSGYTDKLLEGNGTSTSSYSNAGGTGTGIFAGSLVASSQTASTFNSGEVYIPNYAGSTNKSVSVDYVTENNATTSYADLTAGLWSNTAAITSVKLAPSSGVSFVQYSTFSLYGLAQVGTTPAIAPKADGGNVIGTDGTYWYHAFLSNGTFTPQVGLSCDVVTVAGGGAGSGAVGASGGGGGAGGLVALTAQSLTATNYAVTVGAGGTGVVALVVSGTNSQFGTLTAAVGGGGGGRGGLSANNGGSGGGAGQYSSSAGAGTSGQGNAGGSQPIGGSPYPSGGGGGAGAVGANGSGSGGGNGGAGVNTYSSWATATSTGVSGYFAGGGGGGTFSGTAGTGGLGGGGNGGLGSPNQAGGNGVVNTGSGGGGTGGANPGPIVNGNGGSGIVIVRYLVA